MKLNFKIFSKANSLLSHSSKEGTGYSINPVRDWTIGLFGATMCFFIGVAFIGFDFYTQISQSPKQVAAEKKPVNYKEQDVVRYAEFYAEKASTFNKLREQKAYVPPVVETEVKKEVNPEENTVPLAEQAEEQYTDPTPSLAQ